MVDPTTLKFIFLTTRQAQFAHHRCPALQVSTEATTEVFLPNLGKQDSDVTLSVVRSSHGRFWKATL